MWRKGVRIKAEFPDTTWQDPPGRTGTEDARGHGGQKWRVESEGAACYFASPSAGSQGIGADRSLKVILIRTVF